MSPDLFPHPCSPPTVAVRKHPLVARPSIAWYLLLQIVTHSGNSRHAPGGPGSSTHRPAVLLVICYIGFVSLGLPDTPIGVAWPSIRKTFGLQHSDISWLFFGAGTTYILSSFFAGRLLKWMHVGTLLAGSSALVALANFDYSLARAWSFFALGGMLHGLGSGAIDAALNHYVASHFSARHMNWLHACYSLGAMLGPLVMTAMLAWTGSWRSGYLVVAITLLVLSLLFTATRNQWNNHVRTPSHPSPAAAIPPSRHRRRRPAKPHRLAPHRPILRLHRPRNRHRPMELHRPHRIPSHRRRTRRHLGLHLLGEHFCRANPLRLHSA